MIRTRRKYKARGKPLQVPLPRAWKGLVEIVYIENQIAFRRGETTKVKQMCIATELRVQSRHWRECKIGGHNIGRPPIERKWAYHHSFVTDRNQFRDAAPVRLDN